MVIERGELICMGVGVASALTTIGVEVGVKVNEVLISQAPLIWDISVVPFLVTVVTLCTLLLREFPRLASLRVRDSSQIAKEAARASQLSPTLSNGPQL